MKCSIIYRWIDNNKINGTLFYCYEYYLLLSSLINTKFIICNISNDKDKELIYKVFEDKYKKEYLKNDIVFLNRRTDLYKETLNFDKCLFLDVYSFIYAYKFIYQKKDNVYLYMDENYKKYDFPKIKNSYGSYDYQKPYNIKAYLKIGFEYHKKFSCGEMIFISATDTNYIKQYKNDNILLKDENSIILNLFNKIKKIIYVHLDIDTNNRIIPEAFYHNKEIEYINKYNIIDSSLLRYNDIKTNGLDKYKLTSNDEIIKGIINEK